MCAVAEVNHTQVVKTPAQALLHCQVCVGCGVGWGGVGVVARGDIYREGLVEKKVKYGKRTKALTG